MKLPEGVAYRPRQEELIATDRWAIIRIETTGPLAYQNNQYFIDNYSYQRAVTPHLQGNWEQFDRLFNLESQSAYASKRETDPEDIVYSVARHLAAVEREDHQLPNIFVVPNLSTGNWQGLASRWRVFGCTMGHYHPNAGRGFFIQAVYEFQSHGMMTLDRGKGEVELWVAKDGDKVAVPNDSYVTLYNLDDKDNPLIALAFGAELETNRGLARNIGPVLLAYYNDFDVVFSLNYLHINNATYQAGVKLLDPPAESEGRTIRISREVRLNLGGLLYEQLLQNSDLIGQFSRLGIRVKQATPEAILEPLPKGQGSRLYFSSPLVEATQKGTAVYRYFFPNEKAAEPKPASAISKAILSGAQREILITEPRSFDLPLVVVVEGGGDWVEQTYRKLFAEKVNAGHKLAVFYADDARWKLRPEWANEKNRLSANSLNPAENGLRPWEVYLDKSDPEDFAKYLNLRPDVVFIVTPDFTHSTIARHWLGKTPFVLVEKPFDSQIKNVEDLLLSLALGQRHGGNTQVLGLDHYQFYALPICDMKPDIYKHIDYVIANVKFYLTEDRPIEKGRARTLQYGLTLDLLPHFIALLAYFGDVKTIDEISVVEAGQYHPLIATSREGLESESIFGEFRAETSARIKFTFKDHSKNRFHIPCTAVLGKGFSREVKYFELTGRNGNGIRIDLNRKPANPDPDSKYQWDSIFFLQGEGPPLFASAEVQHVPDPYFPKRILRVLEGAPQERDRFCRGLERKRYSLLLDDLLNGTVGSINNTLRLTEGGDIVWALDRIWWAIQDAQPWMKYDLGKLDPFAPLDIGSWS